MFLIQTRSNKATRHNNNNDKQTQQKLFMGDDDDCSQMMIHVYAPFQVCIHDAC